MSDETCPTCKRPKSLGKDMVDELDTRGFFKNIEDRLLKAVPAGGGGVVAGITPEQIEKAMKDAVKGIEFKPTVKATHHGLKELIDCPSCKPELDSYVKTHYRTHVTPTAKPPEKVFQFT